LALAKRRTRVGFGGVISLGVDVFFLAYVVAGMALIFGLWFYYDWREGRAARGRGSPVVYHCIKCGRIYTGPSASDERRCPGCGFVNGRLRF